MGGCAGPELRVVSDGQIESLPRVANDATSAIDKVELVPVQFVLSGREARWEFAVFGEDKERVTKCAHTIGAMLAAEPGDTVRGASMQSQGDQLVVLSCIRPNFWPGPLTQYQRYMVDDARGTSGDGFVRVSGRVKTSSSKVFTPVTVEFNLRGRADQFGFAKPIRMVFPEPLKAGE